MSDWLESVQRLCLKVIAGIGFVIFLFLTFYSWNYTVRLLPEEFMVDTRDNPGITLLILLVLCSVFVGIGQFIERCSKRAMLGAAVVVSFIMGVTAWVFVSEANTYAIADQEQLLLASRKLAGNDGSDLQYQVYYTAYSHQLFLADIIAKIYRLTGSTEEILIYRLQAVLVGLATFAGFGVTRELSGSRKAELLSLLCPLLFFPMRVYAGFFYGETLGVCASLYAIWFFVKMNHKVEKAFRICLYGALTALFVFLAYLARNALIILWIAMFIVQIFQLVRHKRPLPFVMLLAVLIVCLGGRYLMGVSLEKKTGINLKNRMPTVLWIAMGFQENPVVGRGAGSYNNYNMILFEEMEYDGEAAASSARQDLKQRFLEWSDNPGDMAAFLKSKMMFQWNEPTYGALISTSYREEAREWIERLYQDGTADWLFAFLKQYQAIVYLILLIGYVKMFRRQQDPVQYLIGLIVIGGFLFTMVWEAKSRYVYPYIIIAIPFIGGTAAMCCDDLHRLIVCLKKHLTDVLSVDSNKD